MGCSTGQSLFQFQEEQERLFWGLSTLLPDGYWGVIHRG